jgi:hypothetical protein
MSGGISAHYFYKAALKGLQLLLDLGMMIGQYENTVLNMRIADRTPSTLTSVSKEPSAFSFFRVEEGAKKMYCLLVTSTFTYLSCPKMEAVHPF